MFVQVRAFNTGKAGNVPNFCLDNVRRGFGIDNKYGSAWEAWQHTEQHSDRNVPSGLSVPLYYSYTATLDGVTANYGHINVQLPDGRVWSDGNIYPSIDVYTSNHSPRFVGWGESVNDFKIIEEKKMLSEDQFYEVFRGIMGADPTPDQAKTLTREPGLLIDTLWNNGGKQRFDAKPGDAQAKLNQIKEIVN